VTSILDRAINLFRGPRVRKNIRLVVHGIVYDEPSSYNKEGSTTVTANPFISDREEVKVSWKMPGKRDDIRIGDTISCSLSLYPVERVEDDNPEPPEGEPGW
jgi:hypothetical protein